MSFVKISTMPPRKQHVATSRNLRPVYVPVCPDCQGSRLMQVTHQNGMRTLRKCQRCTEVGG